MTRYRVLTALGTVLALSALLLRARRNFDSKPWCFELPCDDAPYKLEPDPKLYPHPDLGTFALRDDSP